MGQLKIVLDTSVCVSNGACLYAAPEVFSHDESRKVRSSAEIVPDSEHVRNAADNCPAAAITLVDPDTGEEIV